MPNNIYPAFNAIQTQSIKVQKEDTILTYEKVQHPPNRIKIGGPMDEGKGIFTAKLRGFYFFTFFAARMRHEKLNITASAIQMLKNGAQVIADSRADTSGIGEADASLPLNTNVAVLLEPGETVSILMLKNSCFYQLTLAFIGFLIAPAPQVKNQFQLPSHQTI